MPDESTQTEAQKIILELINKGLDPHTIVKRSGNRVSERTIYRWMRGETAPEQTEHLRYIKRLLYRVNVEASASTE